MIRARRSKNALNADAQLEACVVIGYYFPRTYLNVHIQSFLEIACKLLYATIERYSSHVSIYKKSSKLNIAKV
jgi:hypothetical protein